LDGLVVWDDGFQHVPLPHLAAQGQGESQLVDLLLQGLYLVLLHEEKLAAVDDLLL
jgi:hypothetical protein